MIITFIIFTIITIIIFTSIISIIIIIIDIIIIISRKGKVKRRQRKWEKRERETGRGKAKGRKRVKRGKRNTSPPFYLPRSFHVLLYISLFKLLSHYTFPLTSYLSLSQSLCVLFPLRSSLRGPLLFFFSLSHPSFYQPFVSPSLAAPLSACLPSSFIDGAQLDSLCEFGKALLQEYFVRSPMTKPMHPRDSW